MRKEHAQSFVLAAVAAGSALLVAPSAHASNPLEYPDNGTASFSRGGAWLATANEPIAAHYNPAALATQGSGFSVEQNMSYSKVCYDRRGPDGKPEVAAVNPNGTDSYQYLPTCNSRSGFPSTIPSISIAWRATKRLGFGFAVVPPATYGIADQQFPALSLGYNTLTKQTQQIPSPYRYMLLDQKSVIVFPTLSVGYELFHNFRVGVGFISGIAVINTTTMGVAQENAITTTDHAADDGMSKLTTRDLFVPGVIASLHWSVTPTLDVAAWGRWIDDVHTTQGELTLTSDSYNSRTLPGAPQYSQLQPICRQADPQACPRATAVPNAFGNDTFKEFRFPIPPEVRIGVRFHLPRSNGAPANTAKGPAIGLGSAGESRDPLHDDLFDVELNGSYTANSRANTIEVRFADNGNGGGSRTISPVGYVPPNADRWNGYIDSYGVRLGGQVNVIQDKLGLRAGTWVETRSQDPAWLQIGVVGGMRGGFGGGIVVRQDFIDISLGYQHQWSNILDNGGHGAMRTTITSSDANPNLNNEPAGVTAANRTQYRTFHTVNDGRLSQVADVFSLGGTIHF
jgi:hypothetical protein